MLGVIPAPFMAVCAATKRAVEGFSESLEHELREYGVRVLLVEPGYTSSQFEMNAVAPDAQLPTCAAQGQVATVVLSAAMRDADGPTVVADVIVKAATDKRPGLRYAAGPIASRVTVLRWSVAPSLFDRRIRKLNRLKR